MLIVTVVVQWPSYPFPFSFMEDAVPWNHVPAYEFLSRSRWWLVLAIVTAVGLSSVGCDDSGVSIADFDVMEKSITELSDALESGQVTSQDLVKLYLARIDAYDQRGPALNAVIVINPDVIADAVERDEQRSSGSVLGPLHGIPVLIKDNYDIANMPTTAGTIGLATSIPPDDAFQVRRLRDAGAIILGKTNMHELARGITTVSSFAGQTRNPYDPTRNPGGSSGGTGAAIGASFAAVGMGSDTCGSIRIPSSHHALVGLRGTRGLASGDGIIPLSTTQDIGGPLARSVEDLALTLDATVGFDPSDPTTALSQGNIPPTYTAFLDEDGLQGARIGSLMPLMGADGAERPVRDVIEAAADTMAEHGATVVEVEAPDLMELLEGVQVIGLEFKFDFDAYLSQTPGAAVRSLSELVELGLYHEAVSGGVSSSLEVESLDTDEYRERIAKRDEVRNATVALMDEHDLVALMYPTIRQTARPIGQGQPGSSCALSAVSGLPAITVPAGFADDGMPVGVELLGRAFTESRLIALAYSFEQATHHRRSPDFTPSLMAPTETVTVSVVVESDSGSESGVSGRARFTVDPSTRILRYTLSVYGVRDDEVLSIDLHRKLEDADNGPSIRLLTRARARATGQFVLTGRDIRLLRDNQLYVDVHTLDAVTGTMRVDLVYPD